MIGITDLTSSIFDHRLFFESPSSIIVRNEKEAREDILKYVVLKSKGAFIKFEDGIFKGSSGIYHKEDDLLSFKKSCDGVLLLDRGDRRFLIFVEVKSGYDEIKNKAFFQLISSYVRIKTLLATIDTYRNEEYEEVGLIISYPFVRKYDIESNSEYSMSRRYVNSRWSSIINKYDYSLRRKNEVCLQMKHFNIDKMHITPGVVNDTLSVWHVDVAANAESGEIDLDGVLDSMLPLVIM